ncbi:MAG: hypothetical protein AAGM67_16615 [Bacteroidota bacterium]
MYRSHLGHGSKYLDGRVGKSLKRRGFAEDFYLKFYNSYFRENRLVHVLNDKGREVASQFVPEFLEGDFKFLPGNLLTPEMTRQAVAEQLAVAGDPIFEKDPLYAEEMVCIGPDPLLVSRRDGFSYYLRCFRSPQSTMEKLRGIDFLEYSSDIEQGTRHLALYYKNINKKFDSPFEILLRHPNPHHNREKMGHRLLYLIQAYEAIGERMSEMKVSEYEALYSPTPEQQLPITDTDRYLL